MTGGPTPVVMGVSTTVSPFARNRYNKGVSIPAQRRVSHGVSGDRT